MKACVFVPAVASGALLWAAFFPLDLGPVAFVALVPWLTLSRAPVSNRRRYFAAYLGGLAFFTLATNWIRVAHPMMYLSWLGLSLVMPVFWLAALALIRQLDRLGLPLALSVPAGWVALEYFRMHFPTGFPFLKHVGAYQMIGFGWYFLGYTQHAFAQLVQIADLGGVYAVSFVVASVNGALAGGAMRSSWVQRLLGWERQPTPLAPLPVGRGEDVATEFSGVATGDAGTAAPAGPPLNPPVQKGNGWGAGLLFSIALLGASVGYGFWRLQHEPFAEGPLVAAIQGDVAQDEKMKKGNTLSEAYRPLHERAMSLQPPPDLIVWPETCFPADWLEVAPGSKPATDFARAAEWSQAMFAKARPGAAVLLGLTALEWEGDREWKYNSALLLDAHGRKVARYDKMHLVPFGEYVPLGDELPFMQWFTPYEKGYECRPGRHWTRFPLKAKDGRDYTFGCLICYEDSDPYLARQYVASEPVNFLVNISNDGWFNGTEEHEQHLAICRFRAVEARRSVVRAVNMGISAVIDPDGRVVALPDPDWAKSKKMDAVVTAAVPLDAREPLYARLGDWVPAACWLTALVGVVVGSVRRKG